jgi:hypothetical protein
MDDAENDRALLEAREVGVAGANAVPSLLDHADERLERLAGRAPTTSFGARRYGWFAPGTSCRSAPTPPAARCRSPPHPTTS